MVAFANLPRFCYSYLVSTFTNSIFISIGVENPEKPDVIYGRSLAGIHLHNDCFKKSFFALLKQNLWDSSQIENDSWKSYNPFWFHLLKRNEIYRVVVHFQLQIDLKDKRPTYFKARIKWQWLYVVKLMPSPSSFSKFGLSILNFLSMLNFYVYSKSFWYKGPKIPFISNLKRPRHVTNRDVLLLATIRYSKDRFLYMNWLIWVYLNCFEYTSFEYTKVIYTKYSKHWPYAVSHTIDCVQKMLDHGLNHVFLLLLFKSMTDCPETCRKPLQRFLVI